jgi:hypothetical protein
MGEEVQKLNQSRLRKVVPQVVQKSGRHGGRASCGGSEGFLRIAG